MLVPRTILAFYDSVEDGRVATTEIHRAAEMPLNHLGLVVHYQDIHDPLPDKKAMAGVRGILIWVYWDSMPDPNAFLQWMIEQMQAGQRVVIMGSHAFENVRTEGAPEADPELINRFWKTFGLSSTSEWVSVTYDIKLGVTSPEMTSFERPLNGALPAFQLKKVNDNGFNSYLKVYRSGHDEVLADLIVTGPKGGYAAPKYSLIYLQNGLLRFWYLNPFRFFREAFATDDLPKPDTTTLSGRRIYYSHVDGDGWRSLSLVPDYREKKKTVMEVLLREVFQKYPDLPVTVAPVAVDLDPSWFGTKENEIIAKEIFALPHVEAGSHTFSHPMDWAFFEHYALENELPYIDSYPEENKNNELLTRLQGVFGYDSKTKGVRPDSSLEIKLQSKKMKLHGNIEIPRAYYTGPFEIEQEIQGSMDIIQKYLPKGKRVELYQWSGDTLAFAEAIKQTRLAGVHNLNGGDTRFDTKFDSFFWVSPIGREVGDQRQIYSSSSNENTYTDFWTKRHYGYGFLEITLRRTETPWRLKPINIYYHSYSGERLASLNALYKNLNYARSQQIAPIAASHFAAIGDGFFSTTIENIGERQWRIKNRDQLQTIRFDHATFDAVDFSRSQGVIGQSHLHGSLYVHLDSEESVPTVALKKIEYSDREPDAKRPYLISGRWWTRNVELLNKGFLCQVQGFGAGDMDWYMPEPGRYRVSVDMPDGQMQQWESTVGKDHRLHIELKDAPIQPFNVRAEAVQVGNGST